MARRILFVHFVAFGRFDARMMTSTLDQQQRTAAIARWHRFRLTNRCSQRPHRGTTSACLPQHPAVAYLFLVRRMRTAGVVISALLALQAVAKDPERIPGAGG